MGYVAEKFPPAGGIGVRGFPLQAHFDIKMLCLRNKAPLRRGFAAADSMFTVFRSARASNGGVVRPHLALADDRVDCHVIIFRGTLELFQQPLYHLSRGGSSGFFFLPIDGSIFLLFRFTL